MTVESQSGCRISWRYVGTISFLLAAVTVPPGVVAYGRDGAPLTWSFAATAALYLAAGVILRCDRRTPDRGTGALLATMALAWLVAPLIGALPFVAAWWGSSSHAAPVVDALFESMSGFTSCGLTMSRAPSELPASLQLWRSLMQWVGGIGIAALMLTVMKPSEDGRPMLEAEVGRVFAGGARAAARWSWTIYLFGTVLTVLAFVAVGRPLWEAVNHGLTAVSTGGFTITDGSLTRADAATQAVALGAMLFGAVSFQYYFRVVTGRRWRELYDVRVLALLLAAGGGAVLVHGLAGLEPGTGPSWWEALFQCGSSIATAGFATTDLSRWSPALLGVLGLLMIVGPMSGSTGGGLKLDRVGLVFRAAWWRVQRAMTAHDELRMRVVERERLTEPDARLMAEAASTLAAIWVAAVATSTFVLCFFASESTSFMQVWFEVVSALSSVGLSAGVTNPDAHLVTKLVLILLMWLGRLELLAGIFLVVTWSRRLLMS